MTEAITTYTSYDAVRAVLGIDETDIPDAVIALDMYAQALERTFRLTVPTVHEIGGDGNLISRFEDLAAKVEADEPTATDEETFYYGQIKLFATQLVARELLPGLSASLKRSESDGKASATRFSSEATFRDIAARVIDSCAGTRFVIMNAVLPSGVTIPQMLAAISPETDIVQEAVRDELA